MSKHTACEEHEFVHILRALSRSGVRMRVLNYMAENSRTPYNAYELSRILDISYGNVVGALRGDSKRYRVEDSLLQLDLIRRYEPEIPYKVELFIITALGYNATAVVNRRKYL
jgi:predicted transcriptional regulator with HTH domain